jgi:hypothetical protein
MISYLEYLAKYSPLPDKYVEFLIADGFEQETIREWCKRQSLQDSKWRKLAELRNAKDLPDNVKPCEPHEYCLWIIAQWFREFRPLSAWEIAPSSDKAAHCLKVAKLARELAEALTETPRPYYPPALQLFDEDQAADIIKSLPEETAKALLACTKYSESGDPACHLADGSPIWSSAAYNLAGRFSFPTHQELAPMLLRLAEKACEYSRETKRDKRPNTGNADARVFARHLAGNFDLLFRRIPNGVIAACVCIMFPEIDPPPNEDTIRSWRDAR